MCLCFLSHNYEVYKEEPIVLATTDKIIGKKLIMKCKDCGKIKAIQIRTNSWTF